MNTTPSKRLSRKAIFLIGACSGAIGFAIAKSLIPAAVANISEHDLVLARNIGFVFPALIGLAAGCIEGSLFRMQIGMLMGSMVGFTYARLCGDEFNFGMIMLGLPCFCGGLMAALVGSSQSPWRTGLPMRLLKGMAAGLACGFIYMLILNILMATMASPFFMPDVRAYGAMMWKAGPLSLAAAGGVFQCLFCWAIGLRSVPAPPGTAVAGN